MMLVKNMTQSLFHSKCPTNVVYPPLPPPPPFHHPCPNNSSSVGTFNNDGLLKETTLFPSPPHPLSSPFTGSPFSSVFLGKELRTVTSLKTATPGRDEQLSEKDDP